MIVSKPKSQALFAIGMFVLVCISLGGYNLSLLIKGSTWFFNYIMATVFLSIAFILVVRQLINYKIISIGKDKVQIWYPLRFSTTRMANKEMISWEETIIQTKTGIFKQLEIVFPTKTIKMSIQENTQYQEAVNYMKRKVSQKRKN
jgi:hypothetical protein